MVVEIIREIPQFNQGRIYYYAKSFSRNYPIRRGDSM